MLTIELRESNTAYCPDFDIEHTARKNGVIDPLARKLIKAGANPEERLHVIRDGKPVFKKDLKLQAWADMRLYEDDRNRFVRRKFKSGIYSRELRLAA